MCSMLPASSVTCPFFQTMPACDELPMQSQIALICPDIRIQWLVKVMCLNPSNGGHVCNSMPWQSLEYSQAHHSHGSSQLQGLNFENCPPLSHVICNIICWLHRGPRATALQNSHTSAALTTRSPQGRLRRMYSRSCAFAKPWLLEVIDIVPWIQCLKHRNRSVKLGSCCIGAFLTVLICIRLLLLDSCLKVEKRDQRRGEKRSKCYRAIMHDTSLRNEENNGNHGKCKFC